MKTYKEIKTKNEKAISDLLEKYQVFFAFSNKQLEEGKTKIGITDNKKLTGIGAGGYMPKKDADAFMEAMEKTEKAYNKELKEAKEAKGEAILYELYNHEAFYTGEIDDVVEKFEGIYTVAEIRAVYKKQYNKNNK